MQRLFSATIPAFSEFSNFRNGRVGIKEQYPTLDPSIHALRKLHKSNFMLYALRFSMRLRHGIIDLMFNCKSLLLF